MGLIWTVTAWAFAIGGGVVMAWAVLWDRARGRLRCGRCWYDLSAAGEEAAGSDLAGGGRLRRAVVCPECGRGHRTHRSLGRTRRRWKWVVVGALVLTLSWHGFERRRAVASRGWMAGVPLPALVLPVAWMSEKPGSVWRGDPNTASGFEFAVAEELAARGPRYGRVARWMLVAIGKRSSAEVITDRTTMKGAVFRTVFERLYAERVLSPAQGRWARSVVWAGFDTRDAWHPETAVHGVLRTRTLVGGPYEVGVLNAPGRFEAFDSSVGRLPGAVGAPQWLGGSGTGAGPMAEPLRAQMMEAWGWDHLQVVRDAAWSGQADAVVAMVDDMYLPEGSTRWYTVWFESSDPNDPYFEPGRRLAVVTAPAEVVMDAAGGPTPRSDAETGAWLAASLRARLAPVSVGFWGGDWRAAVMLEWAGPEGGPVVTFGGSASVVLRRGPGSGGTGRVARDVVLLNGTGCWFRAEPGRIEGLEEWEQPPARVVGRSRLAKAGPGAAAVLVTDASSQRPTLDAGDRLVVRLEPEQNPAWRSVFADLDTASVYLGVVEVELAGWTLEEINRLRVSGVWPNHAMRE